MTPTSTRKGHIQRDVHIGDLVDLHVDGRFFGRTDDNPELYTGYIASISDKVIGLSTTHHGNEAHGYVSGKDRPQRVVTEIEIQHIRDYTIRG